MYKKPSLPKQFLIYIGMTVVALIFMFPLIWMIVSSFKDDAMIFSDITSLKAFAPDVTSYDYDAPISESGQTTPKYWALREAMAKYMDGEKQAKVPALIKPISIPAFRFTEMAPLFENLPAARMKTSAPWKNTTRASEASSTVLPCLN